MKLFWTAPAQRDLEEIFEYIAQENPKAALSLCRRVRDKVELLARLPALGRPGRIEGTREMIITKTPFIVPYRVKVDHIEILAVYHGARRWPEGF